MATNRDIEGKSCLQLNMEIQFEINELLNQVLIDFIHTQYIYLKALSKKL